MKFARAKLTVALVTFSGVLEGPYRAWAQDAAPGLTLARDQATGRQNPVAAGESSVAEGKTLYQHECLSCHGPVGKGDGPKADALDVNPADLSRPKISQQSDEALASRIDEGKKPMPSFRSKFSAHETAALIAYVRTLATTNDGASTTAITPPSKPAVPEPARRRSVGENPGVARAGTNSPQTLNVWTAPSGVERMENPVPEEPSSIAEGNALYQQECLICHGPAGEGDGRKAKTLEVIPADLSNQKMLEQKDGALFWKINEGKAPMPSFRLRFSSSRGLGFGELCPSPASTSRGPSLPRNPASKRAIHRAGKTEPRPEQTAIESGATNSSQKLQTMKSKGRQDEGALPPIEARRKGEVAGKGAGLLQPEYIHVLINPLPVYGLATAMLGLAGALVLRNRPAQVLALGLVVLSAGSAWPVYKLGEKAYHRVYVAVDGDGQDWLNSHKHRAEKLIYLFYALAAVALCAAWVPAKLPKTAFPLAFLTLMVGLVSLGAGGWISKAGGQIRHTEFRNKPASPPALDKPTKPLTKALPETR